MALEKTQRVSRIHPCPVCGRPDWCLASRNGAYAVCMRVESGRPARGGLGGWVHRLRGAGPAYDPAPGAAANTGAAARASPERCHAVYCWLLAGAPAGRRHVEQLQARGFTPEAIAARGYATLPLKGRAALARSCHAGTPACLNGVPGFFLKPGGDGGRYWSIACKPGLLIPCRAPEGQIRAFTMRPDAPGAGGKYVWFSSTGRPGGAGSGAHCHVARPAGPAPAGDTVWVTEGPLKADLASDRLGAAVVAVPGVGSWQRALPDVAAVLPAGGRVVVALDADWRTNPAVHGALWGLTLTLSALGYDAEVAQWDETHKGLDDLLAAGLTPNLLPPASVPAPPWPLRLSSRVLARAPGRPGAAMTLPAMRDALAGAFDASPCRRSA